MDYQTDFNKLNLYEPYVFNMKNKDVIIGYVVELDKSTYPQRGKTRARTTVHRIKLANAELLVKGSISNKIKYDEAYQREHPLKPSDIEYFTSLNEYYHSRKEYLELSEGLTINPEQRHPSNVTYLLNPEIQKEISSFLRLGGKKLKNKTNNKKSSKNKTNNKKSSKNKTKKYQKNKKL